MHFRARAIFFSWEGFMSDFSHNENRSRGLQLQFWSSGGLVAEMKAELRKLFVRDTCNYLSHIMWWMTCYGLWYFVPSGGASFLTSIKRVSGGGIRTIHLGLFLFLGSLGLYFSKMAIGFLPACQQRFPTSLLSISLHKIIKSSLLFHRYTICSSWKPCEKVLLFSRQVDTVLSWNFHKWKHWINSKTLNTICNCQRPAFSLGVSQHICTK